MASWRGAFLMEGWKDSGILLFLGRGAFLHGWGGIGGQIGWVWMVWWVVFVCSVSVFVYDDTRTVNLSILHMIPNIFFYFFYCLFEFSGSPSRWLGWVEEWIRPSASVRDEMGIYGG
jgi:hypothetical protein